MYSHAVTFGFKLVIASFNKYNYILVLRFKPAHMYDLNIFFLKDNIQPKYYLSQSENCWLQ